ncbi:MAG: hypothetical protein DRP64_11325 [Verrucomicrobia bacterium]|nr:MAG: hypothetical protein DRP64_11325 [Verrucomicrobiota bacterium]
MVKNKTVSIWNMGGMALWLLSCSIVSAEKGLEGVDEPKKSFMATKTIFQTSSPYNPGIGIAVDGVVVHLHGAGFPDLNSAISSWTEKGWTVGRMFFADSDGANEYWSGKWDGIDHSDDIEKSIGGEKIMCAGVRPYMVPTPGWTSYLEEQTERALRAGATAILPEEPLAHAYSGYSKSFQQLWEQHYGFPWQAPDHSALSQFLTAQLKSKLYLDLEKKLLETTQAHNKKTGSNASFVIPIHSIYGNIAAKLVAPLGASTNLEGVDGYIGQIWTGPVNWALSQYDSSDKSFFCSAYALYNYFTQLTVCTDKKLWLLVDPVEDDPNHTWDEFFEWYQHCVSAMLLMPEVDSYEIMPWPDRVFLPGHKTGGGSPAPEDFRVTLLAITQALQEMPLGGQWSMMDSAQPSTGISVMISDSAMWQPQKENRLQGIYGQLMPLIERGVPVSACVLERAGDAAYMSRHKVIILSYENFKPVVPEMNRDLAEWVRRGGVLVLLGDSDDALDSDDSWWNRLGHASPMHHLLAQLGDRPTGKSEWDCGEGYVIRNPVSSKTFAQPSVAEKGYLPLIDRAVQHTDSSGKLRTPGYFMMRRGPFVIAHARREPIFVEGKFIDLFHPDQPVIDGIRLSKGASGLFRDVTETLASGGPPLVLHATHRLMSQQSVPEGIQFSIKGPMETPAIVRLFSGGREIIKMTAVTSSGQEIEIAKVLKGATVQLRFQNDPNGVDVTLSFKPREVMPPQD